MEITITDGKAAAMILSKGAELRSFRDTNGRELMWCADPAFWGKSSPLLFPMIGNLRGGKTLINGREYAITKHGFARDNEFSAEKLSESSARFTFTSNDETRVHFPFDFVLCLEYSLTDGKLTMKYTVKNESGEPMPFCIGAHPAFACPMGENEQFSDYKLIFEQNETVKSPVMDLVSRMWGDNNRAERLNDAREFPLRYDLFDNDCVYFDTIRSTSVKLTNTKGDRGVKLSWRGFETLGVWTPDHKNAPFVCIEPWCGCDDYDTDSGVFSEKRGIQTAAPGETKSYELAIESL